MPDLWRLGIALFIFPLTVLIVDLLENTLSDSEGAGIAAFLGLISFVLAVAGSFGKGCRG